MVSSIVVNSSNSNYQVFLLNINNLHIAVWFQIISHNNPKIEQFYLSNEWTLTGQSRPENNGNEQVLYISKSSRIEASTKNTVGGNGVVLLNKYAVSISYNPSHRAAENSHSYASVLFVLCLFVAASHQTRLDTWSKARRPIKVGIKGREGRELAETRTLLVYAAHRLTWCNVNLMRQAVSRTQMWVRARMPGYGLN